ncbi:MAG: GNAT family N-acetyltransferase [Verrucomicrobiota bacterium]
MTEVRLLDDPVAFLDAAGPLLLQDEARNNLILGVTGTLVDTPDRYPAKRFWIATDDARAPVAAAMQTPPYNLLLAPARSEAALEALVESIEVDLPGVVAAYPEVDDFVRLWSRSHAVEPRVLRNQGIYALERVESVPAAPGTRRAATVDDRALVIDWVTAFGEEVLESGDPGRTEARNVVESRLGGGGSAGGFELWEDGGEIVSLSGWGGPTPNGIRIGPVYTPPELRGRGYATSLVAGLSQSLLDGGRRFCFLYTDLANPTSNAVYERVGYVKACESAMVAFG